MGKRLAPYLLAALALLTLLGIWKFAFHGLPLRVIFFPPPSEAPAPLETLQQRISLNVQGKTLAEIAAELERQVGLSIRLDAELTGKTPRKIELDVADVSLRSVLHLLADQADPDAMWRWQNETIAFRMQDDWRTTIGNYEARIHPVGPLLGQISPTRLESIPELVTELIEPSDWEWIGGLATLKSQPGALLVAQTPDAHRRIERLLAALTTATDPLSGSAPIPVDVSPTSETDYVRVKELLRQPASFQCRDLPLERAVRQLATQYGLPLAFDRRGLANAGINLDQPVRVDLPHAPLRTILRTLLEQADADYAIYAGVVFVSAKSRIDNPKYHMTQVYPIQDLMGCEPSLDVSLLGAVEQIISPDSWADVGGNSNLFYCDALVVRTSARVHDTLEQWLRDLRRAAGIPLPRNWIEKQQREVERKLQQPVDMHFEARPVREVLRTLTQHHGLNLVIDETALEKHVIDIDARTCSLITTDQTLNEALVHVLENESLDFYVHDAVLRVSRQDRGLLEWRFYDLPRWGLDWQSLAPYQPWVSSYATDLFYNLPDGLYDFATPESWDDLGGEGVILIFDTSLCVYNSRRVIGQVEQLMRAHDEMDRRRLARGGPVAESVLVGAQHPTKVRKKLDQLVRLEFHKATLAAALRWISEETGVLFEIDPAVSSEYEATEAENPFARHPESMAAVPHLTVTLDEQPLAVALRSMLKEVQLAYVVRNGVVVIVPDDASHSSETRIYDVADLEDAFTEPGVILNLVESMAIQDENRDACQAQLVANHLVVQQTAAMHKTLEKLLSGIRAHRESAYPSPWIGEVCGTSLDPILDQTVDLVLRGESPKDFFVRLESDYGVPIRSAAQNEGDSNPFANPLFHYFGTADWDEPVYRGFFHVPLGDALEQLLPSLGLEMKREQDCVQVLPLATTQIRVRLYPIGPLIDAVVSTHRPLSELPYQPRTRFMTDTNTLVAPEAKLLKAVRTAFQSCPVDGRTLHTGVFHMNRQLLVVGNSQQHLATQGALQTLSDLFQIDNSESVPRRLEKPFDYVCRERPFLQVLGDLSRKADLPIALHPGVCFFESWLFQTRVTCSAENASLASLLDRLLEGRGLSVSVLPHQIEITTKADGLVRWKWRVFDLAPLAEQFPSLAATLDQMLINSTLPTGSQKDMVSWSMRLGKGLVVYQQREAIDELERLLGLLASKTYPTTFDPFQESDAADVDRLLAFLNSTDDPVLRGFGLELFGRGHLNEPRFVGELIELLSAAILENDADYQWQVVTALSRFKPLPPGSAERLAETGLSLNDSMVIAPLINLLATCQGEEGVQALTKIVACESIPAEQRKEAIQQLARFKEDASNALPELLKLLTHQELQSAAAAAIRRIDPGSRQSKTLLEMWEQDKSVQEDVLGQMRNWIGYFEMTMP